MPDSTSSHPTLPGTEPRPGQPESDVDRRRFIQQSVGDVKTTTAWVITSLLGMYRPLLRQFGSLPNDQNRYEPIMPMSTRVPGITRPVEPKGGA